MKKLLFSSILLSCIFANAQVDVTTETNPTAVTYTNLTEAFNAINTGIHTGNIRLSITGNTTETTVTLNAVTTYNSILIKPAAGISPLITSSIGSAGVIKILGNNVTIDGSNSENGTSRDLTIRNSSASTPKILVAGSADENSPLTNLNIKNTNFINGNYNNSATAAILISDGAGSTTIGYFNTILFENNTIQKSYSGFNAVASFVAGNGEGVIVRNNDFTASGENAISSVGIFLQRTNGSIIENNQIGNFYTTAYAKRGIFLTSTTNTIIKDNTISNLIYNGGTGTGAGAYGIHLGSSGTISNLDNIIIDSNTISTIESSSASASYGIGITYNSTSFPANNITISNNKISNVKNTRPTSSTNGGATGISLDGYGSTYHVFNNFVSEISNYGFAVSAVAHNTSALGISVTSGTDFNIYNNTVSLNQDNVNENGTTAAFSVFSPSASIIPSDIDLRNNIFSNTQTKGNRYAIYNSTSNSVFSTIDYNNYFSAGTLGYANGTLATTLAALQTAFGGNMHSKNVSPVFVSKTDLHLQIDNANAELDKAATPLSEVTTDIDGETRDSSTPDIGADEIDLSTLAIFSTSKKSSISIYPNPFTEILTISDTKGIQSISISDASGRQIKTSTPTKNLNLSSLKSGLYFITLKMDDGTATSLKAIKK